MRPWSALVTDVTALVVFAVVGRTSHGEAADPGGVAHTVWPFLVGYLLGLLLALALGPARRSAANLPTGVAGWLGALVGGMLLRLLTGAGTAVSFVIVAAITLALLLLGWRAVYALVRRARRTPSPAA